MNPTFLKAGLEVEVLPGCEALLDEVYCPTIYAGLRGVIVNGLVYGEPDSVQVEFAIADDGVSAWYVPIDLLKPISALLSAKTDTSAVSEVPGLAVPASTQPRDESATHNSDSQS